MCCVRVLSSVLFFCPWLYRKCLASSLLLSSTCVWRWRRSPCLLLLMTRFGFFWLLWGLRLSLTCFLTFSSLSE
jgi:hypothetical protein